LNELSAADELKDLEKDTKDEHLEGIFYAWIYHVTIGDEVTASEKPLYMKIDGPRGDLQLKESVEGASLFKWDLFSFNWVCP